MDNVKKYIADQLSLWPLASGNFRALKSCETREEEIRGLKVRLQHNPARVVSSSAKLDPESIRRRKCFLCEDGRSPEQIFLPFEGRKGREYQILVNPYPIFPEHLVIARNCHVPQSIWHHYVDMTDLARHYPDFTFFYNGPHSGASAPDHFHFQACPRLMMPLERDVDALLDTLATLGGHVAVPDGEEAVPVPEEMAQELEYLSSVQEAQLYHYKKFAEGIFVLRARTSKSMAKLFYRLLDCASMPDGRLVPSGESLKEADGAIPEPLFNLLTWYAQVGSEADKPRGLSHGLSGYEYRAVVVFRSRHRSHHYFSDGPDHLAMSPGCADMGGVIIVPSAEDFAKLDHRLLSDMIREVTLSKEEESSIIRRLTRKQPQVSVGIMSGSAIDFEIISDGAGVQRVSYREGKIDYNGSLYDELYFEGNTMSTLFAEPAFILHDVTIGKEFHWERKQPQTFAGALKFIVEGNKITAVNVIGAEDYLLSVISSEMKSTAPLEFLKAHAVISRSWLAAILERKGKAKTEPWQAARVTCLPELLTLMNCMSPSLPGSGSDVADNGDKVVIDKYFDHEDHRLFDVCADDHCQRYQGLTLAVGDNVREAVDRTWGEVLRYNGEICDARFSKCCGGRSETFSTAWEDKDLPYLLSLPDTPNHEPDAAPFCSEATPEFLATVLNSYDLETGDFYDWSKSYDRAALSELISRRSGEDIGELLALNPLERGGSGRIRKLEIIGTKKTLVVSKELMIRKLLSDSHLKSSAFESVMDGDKLTLKGRGWGHGVGLCQIGAAVMASRGYDYRQILSHYYPGSTV